MKLYHTLCFVVVCLICLPIIETSGMKVYSQNQNVEKSKLLLQKEINPYTSSPSIKIPEYLKGAILKSKINNFIYYKLKTLYKYSSWG